MRCLPLHLAVLALCLYCPAGFSAADAERCKPPAGTQPFEFTDGENHLRGFIDPPARAAPHGAVLILHGSGNADVFHGDTFYNGRYEALRDTFRAAGLATVVWDKAGNGCSVGSYPNGNPIRERAGEAVAALRALKARSDIDATRLGLWGISQGGWVAPMVAVRMEEVRFLILVSSPAA